MDLDEARDRLYAGSPESFVATRKELVAQARAGKDRELAGQVAALRRPTVAAWLVNQLAREAAAPLADLLALGPELAAMHVSGDAAQLRTLAMARRSAVDALVRQAVALGAAQGRAASDQVRQQVATTLEAALAHHAVAERLLQGALVATPESAAAFPLELFEGDGGTRPAATPGTTMPSPAGPASGQAPDERKPAEPGVAAQEDAAVAPVVDLHQAAARREQQARERRVRQQLGHAVAELEQARRRVELAQRATQQAAAVAHEAAEQARQLTGQRDQLRQEHQELAARLAELERRLEEADEQAERADSAEVAAQQGLQQAGLEAAAQQEAQQEAQRRVDELAEALHELQAAATD